MSTHPLGQGTCNLTVNVRKTLRAALGRLAFVQEISMGELVRRMIACASHIWAASKRAGLAKQADQRALAILERAKSNGIGPEDAAAVEQAIRDIRESLQCDAHLECTLDLRKAS